MSELIVMLTHNDITVDNAHSIFEASKDSKAMLWGLKEKGLSLVQMKRLFAHMKECNKTTFLEVVAYTEDECLHGAEMAVECGCDFLMGTKYFDSVNKFCKMNNLRYLPFVGDVFGRPSVLSGDVSYMIAEANDYIKAGVYGITLLAYRYNGNATALIDKFVAGIDVPVCVAGSIDDYSKLDTIKNASPWGFTIGGAFFENSFGCSRFVKQIERVCAYVQ